MPIKVTLENVYLHTKNKTIHFWNPIFVFEYMDVTQAGTGKKMGTSAIRYQKVKGSSQMYYKDVL